MRARTSFYVVHSAAFHQPNGSCYHLCLGPMVARCDTNLQRITPGSVLMQRRSVLRRVCCLPPLPLPCARAPPPLFARSCETRASSRTPYHSHEAYRFLEPLGTTLGVSDTPSTSNAHDSNRASLLANSSDPHDLDSLQRLYLQSFQLFAGDCESVLLRDGGAAAAAAAAGGLQPLECPQLAQGFEACVWQQADNSSCSVWTCRG
jgi:hypothetical protein